MRNNVHQPTIGHVVMFGAASAGWLVLFVISLLVPAGGSRGWLLAAFSGVLMVCSAVFTVVLWRRFSRAKR